MKDPYPLTQWRWIVVNSSGGKDSQTALRSVVQSCSGMPTLLDRVVVSHQCLGREEWKGTADLVRRHARHYRLRFELARYRDREKREIRLLDYVRRRGRWPDSQNRYCTSEFKRSPGGRTIVKLFRESPGPILNVLGFRAEESTARAKRRPFSRNNRFSTASREVWDWLPIHQMSETAVWKDIRESRVPHHFAYDLGMPRLSCCFCIFAPRDALMIAGRHNPELLDEYCDVEQETGHDFQHKRPIRHIRDALRRGEPVPTKSPTWSM